MAKVKVLTVILVSKVKSFKDNFMNFRLLFIVESNMKLQTHSFVLWIRIIGFCSHTIPESIRTEQMLPGTYTLLTFKYGRITFSVTFLFKKLYMFGLGHYSSKNFRRMVT